MSRIPKTELYQAAKVDKLITMRLAHFYVPGYTYDDLVQEGRLAVWNALDQYDPGRGKISTYATRIIKNHFIKLLARQSTMKRKSAEPLAHDVDNLVDETCTIERTLITIEDQTRLVAAVRQARKSLAESEQRAMDCFLEPAPELLVMVRNIGRHTITKSAVAKYIGVKPDKMQGIVNRIKRAIALNMELLA